LKPAFRPSKVVLLGPQALAVTLGRVLPELKVPDGPIATVTAGWQEREGEDEDLDRELGGRSLNLRLYARAERVFAADRELSEAHKGVGRRLRDLRRLYNIRLSHAMDSVMALLKETAEPALVEPERASALETLRTIDAWHLLRIEEMRSEFDGTYSPRERDSVAAPRREIEGILRDAPAVVFAGGHVAVLLNRLRIFGLDAFLEGKILIAWSAGAMVLSERIVLFHDSPPQGPGHAEVFEKGLGLFRGLIPLPHGRNRLRLDDRDRVARFAQRFAPDACVVMEGGTRLDWKGSRWTAGSPAHRLQADGDVVAVSRW
jgi:hypothetical protein